MKLSSALMFNIYYVCCNRYLFLKSCQLCIHRCVIYKNNVFLCIRTNFSKCGNADSCEAVKGKYSISREIPSQCIQPQSQSVHQGMMFRWMTDKDMPLYFWVNNLIKGQIGREATRKSKVLLSVIHLWV